MTVAKGSRLGRRRTQTSPLSLLAVQLKAVERKAEGLCELEGARAHAEEAGAYGTERVFGARPLLLSLSVDLILFNGPV